MGKNASGRENFGHSLINKRYITYFSLRMRKTDIISTSSLKSEVTIVFFHPDFLTNAKI